MKPNLNVNDRLRTLPPKVAVPFRKLIDVGQLDEDVVTTVLDAGELTGDTSRLLAFTIGYLHLRSKGIPVLDVVRMAKQQSRRINLGWTAKRWKFEHDRLARAETLQRMRAANVHYDVSAFACKLPKQFSGYLIRTSVRLGMEGLRQRHCVASYHHQVVAGQCAIAAVFINGQRWTVELRLTPDGNNPLAIWQIKSRHNETPTPAIRERIHAELDIKCPAPVRVPTAGPGREFTYMENLRRVLPVLREHAIETVTVYFDGSGDSGAIDDVNFSNSNFDCGGVYVDVLSIANRFVNGQWNSERELTSVRLDQAIEELTNDYLEATDVDWYNNDGGYGELVIDVNSDTVSLDVNVRYSESENAYSATRDIESGDEI